MVRLSWLYIFLTYWRDKKIGVKKNYMIGKIFLLILHKCNYYYIQSFKIHIMNKKYIFIIPILLTLALNSGLCQAGINYNRHEVKLGYGILSGTEIGFGFANAIGTSIGSSLGLAVGDIASILINGQRTDVTITRIDHKDIYYGTFQINYNRFVSKRLSLGVQASYTPINFRNVVYYSNGTSRAYNAIFDFAQLYGRLDFHYLLNPRFQMYSGLMAGGIYLFDDGDYWWAAHVNLLGFRFGKSHAFYTELGLGFSSTLTVGYSARF
jgi:hypothetical protein